MPSTRNEDVRNREGAVVENDLSSQQAVEYPATSFADDTSGELIETSLTSLASQQLEGTASRQSELNGRVKLTDLSRNIKGDSVSDCPGTCQIPALYSKPHKSLLKVFYVLAVLGMLTSLFVIFGDIMCLVNHDGSDGSLMAQALVNVSCTVLMFVAISFLGTYHDAVFVGEKRFFYIVGFSFAFSIWLAVLKMLNPLHYAIENSPFYVPRHPCLLNGTMGLVVIRAEITMMPFNAECGIIAAGILWQMWSNILPYQVLQCKGNEQPPSDIFESSDTFPTCGKCTTLLQKILSKLTSYFRRNNRAEMERLLPQCNALATLRRHVKVICSLLIAVFVTYISVIQYMHFGLRDMTEAQKSYVGWCLEMAVMIPVLILVQFYYRVTLAVKYFELKREVSTLSGLGSHDKLLLLSCGGTFVLNMLQLISAIELLCRGAASDDNDRLPMAYIGVFYSCFQLYSMWVMTFFLLIVQRQIIRGITEAKIALITLIYVIILNATQWLINNLETDPWVLLGAAYGQVAGMVIGTTLEPIISLYGLHSAMVAYETCKTILADLKRTEN